MCNVSLKNPDCFQSVTQSHYDTEQEGRYFCFLYFSHKCLKLKANWLQHLTVSKLSGVRYFNSKVQGLKTYSQVSRPVDTVQAFIWQLADYWIDRVSMPHLAVLSPQVNMSVSPSLLLTDVHRWLVCVLFNVRPIRLTSGQGGVKDRFINVIKTFWCCLLREGRDRPVSSSLLFQLNTICTFQCISQRSETHLFFYV